MSVLSAASRIGGVTLLSRVLGFLRDILMLREFSFGWALGTFAFAWMVPNLLRRLFGEGALSASFIPAYARARQAGPDQTRHLLASVLGMLLLSLGLLVVVVVGLALWLPPEAVGKAGEDVDQLTQGTLMLRLCAILFPYALPICVAAILAGVLNSHGVFALPAASPVVLNLFWIGGIWLVAERDLQDPAAALELIAWALLLGGLAQLGLSLIPLLRRGLVPLPALPRRGDPGLEVLRSMGPTVLGMSLVQLNTVMDQSIALWLIDPEAPGYIYFANRLLLFPHALTSLALATALFPRLAEAAAKGELQALRQLLDRAIQHITIIALPAALGLMMIADPLLALMGGDSLDDPVQLERAAWTTALLAGSLPFIGAAQLQARALFSLGDYAGPAWMSLWLLLINLILNLLFVLVLDMGVAGLALATSIASIANTLGLRIRLRRHLPTTTAGMPLLGRALLASAVMAAAVYGTQHLQLFGDGQAHLLFDRLLIPVLVGVGSYGGLMYCFGLRSLRLRS